MLLYETLFEGAFYGVPLLLRMGSKNPWTGPFDIDREKKHFYVSYLFIALLSPLSSALRVLSSTAMIVLYTATYAAVLSMRSW